MFPSSMLSGLVVRGSLKNTPEGFEIRLRNNIESGTITGLGPLGVDDQQVSPDRVVLKVGDKEMHADQIAPRSPLSVRVMSEIRITVEGEILPAGQHKLSFSIMTAEAGRLNFSVTETVPEQV